MPPLSRVVLTAATLLLTSLSAQAAPRYRITDLGDLGDLGEDVSRAFGINNTGQVVGYSVGNLGASAFLWTAGGGMKKLDDLPGESAESQAYSINNAGQVVGSNFSTGAFLWTAGGGMQNLGDGAARSINSAGQVVGERFGATGPRAFLWTAGGGMQDLRPPPEGLSSSAEAINDAGQVVGNARFAGETRQHAFLWTADDGMQNLGALPGGIGQSFAYDINNEGQVVGVSYAATGLRAFLWTAGGGMQDLGALPGLGSVAEAINNAGQVVGGTENVHFTCCAGDADALLWTASGGMQNLNALIDPLDPLKAVTRLGHASDINDVGQIVGTAVINKREHAFLLTPVPEPASWALLLAGLAWTGLMVRQRAS